MFEKHKNLLDRSHGLRGHLVRGGSYSKNCPSTLPDRQAKGYAQMAAKATGLVKQYLLNTKDQLSHSWLFLFFCFLIFLQFWGLARVLLRTGKCIPVLPPSPCVILPLNLLQLPHAQASCMWCRKDKEQWPNLTEDNRAKPWCWGWCVGMIGELLLGVGEMSASCLRKVQTEMWMMNKADWGWFKTKRCPLNIPFFFIRESQIEAGHFPCGLFNLQGCQPSRISFLKSIQVWSWTHEDSGNMGDVNSILLSSSGKFLKSLFLPFPTAVTDREWFEDKITHWGQQSRTVETSTLLRDFLRERVRLSVYSKPLLVFCYMEG